jgi:hypothetical protein
MSEPPVGQEEEPDFWLRTWSSAFCAAAWMSELFVGQEEEPDCWLQAWSSAFCAAAWMSELFVGQVLALFTELVGQELPVGQEDLSVAELLMAASLSLAGATAAATLVSPAWAGTHWFSAQLDGVQPEVAQSAASQPFAEQSASVQAVSFVSPPVVYAAST